MRTLGSPFELVRVTAVRHVRDHVLWLEFSDGVSGEVDLSDVLGARGGPVFEPLRDPREFAQVRLGAATIEWPNGADWAPESLHERVLAGGGKLAGDSSESQFQDDAWLDASRHSRDVPELSRFYGIVIHMFYADHVRPHFHAWFGGEWIAVEIDGDGR